MERRSNNPRIRGRRLDVDAFASKAHEDVARHLNRITASASPVRPKSVEPPLCPSICHGGSPIRRPGGVFQPFFIPGPLIKPFVVHVEAAVETMSIGSPQHIVGRPYRLWEAIAGDVEIAEHECSAVRRYSELSRLGHSATCLVYVLFTFITVFAEVRPEASLTHTHDRPRVAVSCDSWLGRTHQEITPETRVRPSWEQEIIDCIVDASVADAEVRRGMVHAVDAADRARSRKVGMVDPIVALRRYSSHSDSADKI